MKKLLSILLCIGLLLPTVMVLPIGSISVSALLALPSAGEPIDWRFAPIPAEFAADDMPVIGYNLADYFDNSSGGDASDTLQRLMNLMAVSTGSVDQNGSINSSNEVNRRGGTIYIPSGRWAFYKNLRIPQGVTICGDWKAPTDGDLAASGTIIEVYPNYNNPNGTAFIQMLPNSCIRNLTFWYPEQDPASIVPYPPTILMMQPNNFGADYTHIRNVTLINSYFGIKQGPNGSGCPTVHTLYGTTLSVGLDQDGIADVGRFDFLHLSPKYWIGSGLPGAPASGAAKTDFEAYMKENSVGFIPRRTDWSYWTFCEVEGYHQGIAFLRSKHNEHLGFSNGQCYDITIRNCEVGIYFWAISGVGQMFANINIENCKKGIEVIVCPDWNALPAYNDRPGNAQWSWVTIDADIAIEHRGKQYMNFLQSTIKRGKVIASDGPLTMSDCDFQNAAPHVILETDPDGETNATGAILLGNRWSGGEAVISNANLCPVKFDNTPLAVKTPKPMTAQQAAERKRLPAQTALNVVSWLTANGQVDVTDDLQFELDLAKAEGGGIVFLTPGRYRIEGSLTIPSGVELRGSVDMGRIPFNTGTILKIVGGKGQPNGAAAVSLEENSGIRAIVFDYPEQVFRNSDPNERLIPHEYPYAIRGLGKDVYIINTSIRNGYNGVDLMTNKCDNHYVQFLAGFCLKNVIKAGGGSKGGYIGNMQFNTGAILNGEETKYGSWPNSPLNTNLYSTADYNEGRVPQYYLNAAGLNSGTGAQNPVSQKTKYAYDLLGHFAMEEMIFMQFGDCTDQIIYDNFTYRGWRGAQFIAENNKAANGWFIGNAFDCTTVGLEFRAIGDMDVINPQVVSMNPRGEADIGNELHHVMAHESFTGTANIYNMDCWAAPYSFVRVGGGTVNIYNSDYESSPSSR
ncbi:MAG: glycoside hydrolase family 55 protein, partial [Oscillospiraceae bacterium]|nr:glycoside hydrolase family 55 protein [Oscillospiraceae bacterium]